MITDVDRKKLLGSVLKQVHNLAPSQQVNTLVSGSYEIKKGYIGSSSFKRLVVYLRSTGCQYMRDNENGGCAMCGHFVGTTRGRMVTVQEYSAQFQDIISKIDFTDIPMICVYNAGSFLNNEEISPDARRFIYKTINSMEDIKYVIFESRPEHINENKIREMRKFIPDKRIEIGIGLESSDPYVRDICLNKGLDVDILKQSLAIMKKYDIKCLGYVLLKPPFMNERLAIEDSVRSIKWAVELGFDVVSLEPVSVQRNTLIDLLYRMGEFRPPWIWSVMSVVMSAHGLCPLRIGGFEFFPRPDVYTHNCPVCDEKCVNAIEEYNATGDVQVISDVFNAGCSNCKERWFLYLYDEESIADKVDQFIDQVSSRKNFVLDILGK